MVYMYPSVGVANISGFIDGQCSCSLLVSLMSLVVWIIVCTPCVGVADVSSCTDGEGTPFCRCC